MTSNIRKLSKISNLWSELSNPIRYLTKSQIQQMLTSARQGNDVRLQLAFYEMERTMPIYGIVIQKRIAALQNKTWTIVSIDDSDKSDESNEQIKAIQAFFNKLDSKNEYGLTNAIRHLIMANFRGRSVIKPLINGEDIDLVPLDNWNVLQYNNKFYWASSTDAALSFCPSSGSIPTDVVEIDKSSILYLTDNLPIDIPGIEIYLRQMIGEDTWTLATQRYGIAPIIITAPEGTSDSALPQWSERALRLVNGGSGVLPPGADVKIMTEARGQDPFSEYVQHQTEQIVLLACGSTLGTLAGATGLGSNVANVQKSSFDSLVDYDAKRIMNAINNTLIPLICKILGFDKVLCKFEYTTSNRDEIENILKYAKMLTDMGVDLDIDKLKTATSLDFIKTDEVEDTDNNINTNINTWSPKDDN